MAPKIKILTGRVHSGKTTSLFRFISENKNSDGILAPIVNDKRRLYHISTRTIKELEVIVQNEKTVSVGKYHFLRESFDWANHKLLESFNANPQWLIIDEIGKLELQGDGIHVSTKKIIENISKVDINLILVIRDFLLQKALKYYDIKQNEYEILTL